MHWQKYETGLQKLDRFLFFKRCLSFCIPDSIRRQKKGLYAYDVKGSLCVFTLLHPLLTRTPAFPIVILGIKKIFCREDSNTNCLYKSQARDRKKGPQGRSLLVIIFLGVVNLLLKSSWKELKKRGSSWKLRSKMLGGDLRGRT